jgi:hypothetical protein
VAKLRKHSPEVFLNVPDHKKFERLFLAFIAGTSAFGLTPRTTLEITTSVRRFARILDLIRRCEYSIHDLSRVEIDRPFPSTPRFNMPFELGWSVALQTGEIAQRFKWYRSIHS